MQAREILTTNSPRTAKVAPPKKGTPARSSRRRSPFSDLPWLDHLPKEERKELLQSAKTLSDAGDFSALAQLLIEWKATAEIYADPELFARLTATEDDVDL